MSGSGFKHLDRLLLTGQLRSGQVLPGLHSFLRQLVHWMKQDHLMNFQEHSMYQVLSFHDLAQLIPVIPDDPAVH